MTDIAWPKKTRDIKNHHMDSTLWDYFRFRDDDIIVATYQKSGTTWMQQIIAQLLFNGDPNIDASSLTMWIDFRVQSPEARAALEAQQHRRFVKTHLPVDALVFSPSAKYIYVARDGRDTVWSRYNHHANMTAAFYRLVNDTPGRVGPPIESPPSSVHAYYRQFLENDGFPYWPFWENVRSWWSIRDFPNIKRIHFNDLKRDLPGSIRSIAAFLGITVDERKFADIVEHCTFDYMKIHTEKVSHGSYTWLEGGAKTFIHKGTNGRWKDVLSPGECAEYDVRAVAELGQECASWLADVSFSEANTSGFSERAPAPRG